MLWADVEIHIPLWNGTIHDQPSVRTACPEKHGCPKFPLPGGSGDEAAGGFYSSDMCRSIRIKSLGVEAFLGRRTSQKSAIGKGHRLPETLVTLCTGPPANPCPRPRAPPSPAPARVRQALRRGITSGAQREHISTLKRSCSSQEIISITCEGFAFKNSLCASVSRSPPSCCTQRYSHR